MLEKTEITAKRRFYVEEAILIEVWQERRAQA